MAATTYLSGRVGAPGGGPQLKWLGWDAVHPTGASERECLVHVIAGHGGTAGPHRPRGKSAARSLPSPSCRQSTLTRLPRSFGRPIGGGVGHVQKLRHAQLRMTAIYTHVATEDLGRAAGTAVST